MYVVYIPSVAVSHNTHLAFASTSLVHNPFSTVLSNGLIIRDVVDQHTRCSIAVGLGDGSTITALLGRSVGNNLLQLASSVCEVDSSRAASDQVPQLLAHKDLDFLGNVRSLVVLELDSQRESGDDGDRRCTTSAHVSDSVPAIL